MQLVVHSINGRSMVKAWKFVTVLILAMLAPVMLDNGPVALTVPLIQKEWGFGLAQPAQIIPQERRLYDPCRNCELNCHRSYSRCRTFGGGEGVWSRCHRQFRLCGHR